MILLALALLAAAPQEELRAIDRQEALNDELEKAFDGVCGALKGGRRVLAPDLALAGVRFPVDELVQVPSCSLRALAIKPQTGDELPLRLLWDIDGRDAQGRRVSVRGETDGAVKKVDGRWLLSRVELEPHRRVVRDTPRFVERAAEAGLVLPPRAAASMPAEFLSGGLTVRDLDGDARPDVVMLDGPRAYLFRNTSGDAGVRFAAPTVLATAPKWKTFTSAAAGDFDGDGDPDLALTTYRDEPVRLFANERGAFREVGSVGRGAHHQMALPSDLDGDGKLDLAVLTYPLEGRIPSSFLMADNGEPPELWLGNGDLTFRRRELPPGVAQRHWTFAGVAADLVGQGGMQLYLVNDFGVKDLYAMLPDGGVEEIAERSGLRDPGPGMSLDLGDIDGDGRVDIYVSNMFSKAGTRIVSGLKDTDAATKQLMAKHVRGNTLFVAQPDGGYADRAEALDVHRALWSFGALMSDVDDDGRLEVLVANGYISAPNRRDL